MDILKRSIPYLLAAAVLAATMLVVSGIKPNHAESRDKSTGGEAAIEAEMKGVWVTYMTLDVEGEQDKEKAFGNKIDTIIEDMKAGGFNTMIVQVRPFSDAIYRSAYYPWSHIISGEQGVDPGFDPLEMICGKCSEKGISVHAWVNPYRVSTNGSPTKLSADNPYAIDDSIGVRLDSGTYLRPESKKARELITDGVIELVENYDVDGIQFDDYFYPTDWGDSDAQAYEEYKSSSSSPLSLEEYRKENVSELIRSVYSAVRGSGREVMFGIAPQGNLPNNDILYADVRRWCTESGFIDYICPQIYFSLDNPALTFEDALAQWLELKIPDNIKLYVGLSGYKAGTDDDGGTWLDNDDILATEIAISRDKGADGFMLYSYDSIHNKDNRPEIENVMRYLNASPTQ